MRFSYYTIDNLDLGFDPKGVNGWRLCSFLQYADGLEHYDSLPLNGRKSFGLTDGLHPFELVRYMPNLSGDGEGQHVLAADFLDIPSWLDKAEALKAVRRCAIVYGIKHRLDGDRVVPITADELRVYS